MKFLPFLKPALRRNFTSNYKVFFKKKNKGFPAQLCPTVALFKMAHALVDKEGQEDLSTDIFAKHSTNKITHVAWVWIPPGQILLTSCKVIWILLAVMNFETVKLCRMQNLWSGSWTNWILWVTRKNMCGFIWEVLSASLRDKNVLFALKEQIDHTILQDL